MKLEAVIICINYADFLRHTLPTNKAFFDKLVVVTDMKDEETPKVCEIHNVQCIRTNAFYSEGSKKPNKAAGINEGLKKLALDGWVVQLDADIWLPSLTKSILQKKVLNPQSIYGIDRLMCNSYQEWHNFINFATKGIHEGWVYLHLHYFPLGQRIVFYNNEDGYTPIGFFQLWNPKGSGVYTYPQKETGFARTDLLHARQFPRGNRDFIPDFVCVHLASEHGTMGHNWSGRKSQRFAPKFPITIWNLITRFFHRIWMSIINFFKWIFCKPTPPYINEI